MKLAWLVARTRTRSVARRAFAADGLCPHRRRRVQRGVTPLELIVALVALALVGVVASLILQSRAGDDSQRMAEQIAERIRSAAEQWQQEHSTGCPTISQLVRDRALDPDERVDDPWGSRYRVLCSGPVLTVRSSGKDGQTGTADDIRIPRS